MRLKQLAMIWNEEGERDYWSDVSCRVCEQVVGTSPRPQTYICAWCERQENLDKFIAAFDHWNIKKYDHSMVASAAWEALVLARERINDKEPTIGET